MKLLGWNLQFDKNFLLGIYSLIKLLGWNQRTLLVIDENFIAANMYS